MFKILTERFGFELMVWVMASRMSSKHSFTAGSTEVGPSKVSLEIGLEMAEMTRYLVVWATVRRESLSKARLEAVLRTDPFRRSLSLATARQYLATFESPKTSKTTILLSVQKQIITNTRLWKRDMNRKGNSAKRFGFRHEPNGGMNKLRHLDPEQLMLSFNIRVEEPKQLSLIIRK